MDWLYGIIGFLGFEALRIYKRLWANLNITPWKSKSAYIFILFVISIFSGLLANVFASGNVIEAIYIGFSVPTGAKAILEMPKSNYETVDDINDIIAVQGNLNRWLLWSREYFKFF